MPSLPQGYTPLSFQEVKDLIDAIFIEVFGPTVNLNPTSINGLFIQQLTNLGVDNETTKSVIYGDLYNPNVTQSIWLEAICALMDINRKSATHSSATCVFTGSAGTVIPKNSIVANSNNDKFNVSENITLNISGTASAIVIAQELGPISVNNNTIVNIITPISGWDSVNNPTIGTIGTVIQSDNSLRLERTGLLAKQSASSIGSIYAKVYDVQDVTDVMIQENNTGAPKVIGGVTLKPYSIYLAVIGGINNNIGEAIYIKKSPVSARLSLNLLEVTTSYFLIKGRSNKNCTFPVGVKNTDKMYNYDFFYRFQRPIDTPLKVLITIGSSPTYPPDIVDKIKKSVVSNFNGEFKDIPRVKIGQIINVSRFYPSILALGVYLIENVTIGLASGGTQSFQIQLDIDKIASLIESNVIVTVVENE